MEVLWTQKGGFSATVGYVTSEETGTLGETFTINLFLQSNSYLCRIYVKSDDDSQELIYSGYGGGTVQWTPPLSAALRVRTSRYAAYQFEYIIYNSSAGHIIDGGYRSVHFLIPIYPKITAVDVTDTKGLYAKYGKFIQHESVARVKATIEIDKTYGVSPDYIYGYLTVGSSQYGDFKITNFTRNDDGTYECTVDVSLPASGQGHIRIVLYDARAHTAVSRYYLDILAYDRPTVSIENPYRCDADGNAQYDGTYACTTLSAVVANLDGLNCLNTRLRWTASDTGAASYSDTYTSKTTLSVEDRKIIFPVKADTQYVVAAECWDNITTINSTIRYVLKVSPMLDIDRTNNAFGVGTVAKEPNTICFGAKAIFEQGTDLPCYVPNLLDNSNFANIVDQLAYVSNYMSTIPDTGFAFDRWHSDCTVTKNTGTGISIPSGGRIWQVIPTKQEKTGTIDASGVFTFAAMTTGGITHIISGKFADNPDSGVVAMNDDYSVILREGQYKWAALYEGEYDSTNLPTYYSKRYSEELTECRRYCQVLTEYSSVINRVDSVGHFSELYEYYESEGTVTNRRYVSSYIPLAAPMRIVPTIIPLDDNDQICYVFADYDYIEDSVHEWVYFSDSTIQLSKSVMNESLSLGLQIYLPHSKNSFIGNVGMYYRSFPVFLRFDLIILDATL